MYRRISVHLDHGFDCKRRTDAALGLARRHKAELVGIYANAAPPQYYYGESVLMSRAASVMEQLQTQSRDAVLNGFLASAAAADVPAAVRAGEASPSATVAALGRASDLIVVSQENREDVEAAHEIEFVEQTLLTAGRPVLVVPSIGAFPVIGERVLCCWDGSREAARALADAAPSIVDRWDSKSLSIGAGYGNFTGSIIGRVIDVPGKPGKWEGLGIGLTWRTPWSGQLTVGAENVISRGKNPFSPRNESNDDGTVPYVRYEQDL